MRIHHARTRGSLLVAAMLFANALSRAQGAPASPALPAQLDSIVQQHVTSGAFSGVVLVAKGGEVVFQRTAGHANRESTLPVTLNSRLQTASVTKLYTQIAIRQLEQAGKLRLSDTVGTFLPRYANPDVRRKVTVEQLLQHRSGVGSFWNQRFMAAPSSIRTVSDYIALFQDDSLLFEPGSKQAYSNGGYVLLGAIIEAVSGQTYHEYLRTHIFGPAGMRNTMPYDSRISIPDMAVGYTRQAVGPAVGDTRLAGAGPRPAPGTDPMMPNAPFMAGMASPAGDYLSTVGDFLLLARAITAKTLLDATHTEKLLGPRYARGEDFRSNGGGPGVNAEFSMYPNGYMMIVLANYDPPSATQVAQGIRALIATR